MGLSFLVKLSNLLRNIDNQRKQENGPKQKEVVRSEEEK